MPWNYLPKKTKPYEYKPKTEEEKRREERRRKVNEALEDKILKEQLQEVWDEDPGATRLANIGGTEPQLKNIRRRRE